MPFKFKAPNDDSKWADGSGLYSKALKQKHDGIVDAAVFKSFLDDIERGAKATKRPIDKPSALFDRQELVGPTTKLNGPQGAFADQPVGPKSKEFTTAIPPRVGSKEYAVELAELYWAALLRDVPFTQFDTHPLVAEAVKHLNANISDYRGPRDKGKITPRLLFRAGLPKGKRSPTCPAYFADEAPGPYVSQFCLWPTSLGAQPIDQLMKSYMPGQDFMTDIGKWSNVQAGKDPGAALSDFPVRKFMNTGRAFASFTRQDELYQAYLTAYLVLKTWKVGWNPGSPYEKFSHPNQQPFGTFGGPDIAATLGAVAKAAINAVWYQKWAVHLRHRPESGGGLVHLWKTGAKNQPEAIKDFDPDFAKILDPVLNLVAQKFSRPGVTADADKTFLLPQAFPEGSPPHPAYPTGHGAVAGACITALKFFFDCDRRVSNFVQPVAPSHDGLNTGAYCEPDADEMTINGELHKLAHNISFGHGIHAGIHWRSDTDESIIFGEQVALAFLKVQAKQYSEPFSLKITMMDGKPFTIGNRAP